MAINKNDEIRRLHTFGDRVADRITRIAGSMPFLTLNVVWFVAWLLFNTGALGGHMVFDKFPFGFLTTAVSLEAIVLSIFVLISQMRQAKMSELRAELDYRTDLEAESEIKTIVCILERLAKKQGIDVSDLVAEMKTDDRKILSQHPAVLVNED